MPENDIFWEVNQTRGSLSRDVTQKENIHFEANGKKI